MSGGRFAAAHLAPIDDAILGERISISDHKLYFIPLQDADEAAYLTELLNAPSVATAVGAYAAQLSLGVSVAEYLHLPLYDAANGQSPSVAALARRAATGGNVNQQELDEAALNVIREAQRPNQQ